MSECSLEIQRPEAKIRTLLRRFTPFASRIRARRIQREVKGVDGSTSRVFVRETREIETARGGGVGENRRTIRLRLLCATRRATPEAFGIKHASDVFLERWKQRGCDHSVSIEAIEESKIGLILDIYRFPDVVAVSCEKEEKGRREKGADIRPR